jgi:hypothetical protein
MAAAFAKPSQESLRGNHSLRPYYALLFAFAGFLIVALLVLDAFAPGDRRVAKITGVDGPVYFGIAHSLLFDRDFDLTNEIQHFEPADRMWTLVQKSTGRPGSVPSSLRFRWRLRCYLRFSTGSISSHATIA